MFQLVYMRFCSFPFGCKIWSVFLEGYHRFLMTKIMLRSNARLLVLVEFFCVSSSSMDMVMLYGTLEEEDRGRKPELRISQVQTQSMT